MNLLIVGDGYETQQLGLFHNDCDMVVGWLQSEPWHSQALRYRIFRQDVWSTDSGVVIPAGCEGPESTPSTYFGAKHGTGALCRLISGTNSTVRAVADLVATQVGPYFYFQKVCVLVNSDIYGGSCGGSTTWVAAHHPQSKGLFLHELGHSMELSDEYDYYLGCDDGNDKPNSKKRPVADNLDNRYTHPKWKDWRNLPAGLTVKGSCGHCLPESALNGFADDAVGAFQGGGWYRCGVCRPSPRCRMKDLKYDFFCTTCQRSIVDFLT